MGGNSSTERKNETSESGSFCKFSEIDKLVKRVTTGFVIQPKEMPHEISTISKELVDKKKPLKNLATDFVVNEFFRSAESLYLFLDIVHSVYRAALDRYQHEKGLKQNDLIFMFKGGNILRFIANEFLNEFPKGSIEEIQNYYSIFFKRSDNDFSILINPHIADYDTVYLEIATLSYLLQNYLRKIFLANMLDFFDYPKYNPEYKQEILSKYLENLKSIDEKYTKFYPQVNLSSDEGRDFLERYNDSDKIAVAKLNNSGSIFKITHNFALDFIDGSGLRVKFELTRMKIYFVAETEDGETTSFGGELIDVSIPHRDQRSVYHFFEDISKNISTYTLKYSRDDAGKIVFLSSSISYLTEDLEYILFKFNDYPWQDEKYKKRLNRLLYLYFVNIFTDAGAKSRRFEVIDNFRKLILSYKEKGDRVNVTVMKGLSIEAFVEYLEAISYAVDKNPMEREGFDDFLETILVNIDFFYKILSNVKRYCKTDGITRSESIYTANVSDFA